MELDQEQGDLQKEEGGTQEDSKEERKSETQGEHQDEPKEQDKISGEEESSEGGSESSVGRERKGDSQSTLTSEEDSENEQAAKTTTKPYKPIPPLIDSTVLPPASNTTFDLEDPLGIKAMRVAMATMTGSKGLK